MCFMNPGPAPEIELKKLKKTLAEVINNATDCEVKLSKLRKQNAELREEIKELKKELHNAHCESCKTFY